MSLPYITMRDRPLNCAEPTDTRYDDDELFSIRALHLDHVCDCGTWMDKEIARRGLGGTP